MNFTVVVPEGSSNHGDPRLICLIPRWHDYITFFLANYLAHAATLVTFPGQSVLESISYALAALLLPSYGVLRTVKLLFVRPGLERDPLHRAAKAGALCMVVAKWIEPEVSEHEGTDSPQLALSMQQHEMWFPLIEGAEREARSQHEPPDHDSNIPRQSTNMSTPQRTTAGLNWWPKSRDGLPSNCSIHGLRQLPSNYEIIQVPPNIPLRWRQSGSAAGWNSTKGDPFLASSYNVPKIVVSLLQSVWASITLYRTRGNQIDQYGYAAFGLTVAPYAFMSAVNILANLVMPEYPAMFIVHTPDLDKAVGEGGVVEGVVAEIDPDKVKGYDGMLKEEWGDKYPGIWYIVTTWVLLFTPLIIVGALSRFTTGESSTVMQRGFIMSWQVVSIACGVIPYWHGRIGHAAWIGTCWIFAAPAIGGMVMVGLEIKDYGVCTKIL